MRDLGLLELFAEKAENRAGLRRLVDFPSVIRHLSDSLKRELDFRMEAANVDRLAEVLERYSRLAVPSVYHELSTQAAARARASSTACPSATRPTCPSATHGCPPADRVVLPADPRRRLLPRRPAPRQPALVGRQRLLPRLRHGRRGRPEASASCAAARDGVLAGGRRVPRRDRALSSPDAGAARRLRPRPVRARDLARSVRRCARAVAAGDPARPDPPGDHADRRPPRRPAPGRAGADGEGARADAARGDDARPRARPVLRRRPASSLKMLVERVRHAADPKRVFYEGQKAMLRFRRLRPGRGADGRRAAGPSPRGRPARRSRRSRRRSGASVRRLALAARRAAAIIATGFSASTTSAPGLGRRPRSAIAAAALSGLLIVDFFWPRGGRGS